MTEYLFSRFIYLDTNIISHFVKNENLWPKFHDYLKDSSLTLAVGGGQVSELSDAKSLIEDLARFLVSVPTGIIKNWDNIIAEEVEAHPDFRTVSLLMYPLNAILLEDNGFSKLLDFFGSASLSNARADQLNHAKQMLSRHSELKSNFPPASSGRYEKEQANDFAMAQVLQWLVYDHRDFLEEMQKDISLLNIEVFKSIRMFAYVMFYKYYLGQRDPNKLSDFGDLFHLFPLPYCAIVVLERDLANVLSQIKTTQPILGDTQLFNIDFINQFEG